MSHPVVCPKCGERFDRDIHPFVRVGARRYGHPDCYPDLEVESPPQKSKPIAKCKPKAEKKQKNDELATLKKYISQIYGDKANWQIIMKQIKSYQKEYNYTLSGILKSLMWFYEVKGNSVEGSNGGIGIVPYCYRDAFNYYYSIFIANQANQNKTLNNEVKEICIPIPTIRNTLKHSLINLDKWEPEE